MTKHCKEEKEDLFLNNNYNNSGSSSEEDSSDDEGGGILKVKSVKKSAMKMTNFIHNDLRGMRNGGPSNGGDKICEGCGKFASKYLYLALNFECGDDENHPKLSRHCAMEALTCCVHPLAKKRENYDEDVLRIDD